MKFSTRIYCPPTVFKRRLLVLSGVNSGAFPDALFAKEANLNGTLVRHPSSVSPWAALRELSAAGAVSSPPRGPSQLMVYNAASVQLFGPLTVNIGAVRCARE